jgi:hypothetical protein
VENHETIENKDEFRVYTMEKPLGLAPYILHSLTLWAIDAQPVAPVDQTALSHPLLGQPAWPALSPGVFSPT